MDREQFLEEVKRLKTEGKSIRALAVALDVPKGKIERAFKTLARRPFEKSAATLDQLPSSTSPGAVFVGRQREMAELQAALEDTISGHGRLVMGGGAGYWQDPHSARVG